MKQFLLIILSSLFFSFAFAAHISGGEMYYKYIGPGTAPNTSKYEITLRLFRDCSASGTFVSPMPLDAFISVFDNTDDSRVSDNLINRDASLDKRLSKIDFSCIQSAPEVCYDVGYYHFETDLPKNQQGYTCAFQTCCRVGGINNIFYNFGSMNGAPGVTVSCKISGVNQLGTIGVNSSPIFKLKDTALVCANNFFNLDFSANDDDLDSLSYSFCDAYGCSPAIVNATSTPSGSPSNTIFPFLDYNGFNGGSPLGSPVKINAVTGIISGNAPAVSGRYVIDVCITEWRNGIAIGSHRKDFILKIADCNKTTASLNPQYFTCDGFTLNFTNNATNVSGIIYNWNFGDTASGINNTSASATPTHTYSDTGIYILKLKVSVNGLCEDSATAKVKVYPGFFPAFNVNPPYCKGVPVSFTDKTTSKYGVPTGWRWDFGNTAATNDTSNNKNPFYAYSNAGDYKITLIVGNTFGCIDTIFRDIKIIENPVLTVTPKDTSYCALDSVLLTATGTGSFSWAPSSNIIAGNTSTPIVFPSAPAKYIVSLTANGCISRDSVNLTPLNNLTNAIAASATSICEDDTITLTGSSNYTTNVSWQWSPAITIITPTEKITKAFPPANITYTLKTRWGGNCTATAAKNIVVKKLLVPQAGPDTYICLGQQTAALQASGADAYQWLPATGLSNPNIANPIAFPSATTIYKVTGSTTGCAGKKVDSLIVTVKELPPLTVTNDTLICSIDTLQLKATGTGSFLWSPNYSINNLTSATPLISPDVPTKYFVRLTDGFGCVSNDSVFVDVKLFVTINAGNDTTLCRNDGFFLNTSSDALSYKWQPPVYLSSDTAKRPFATPLDPFLTYKVTGNIGKCQSTDFVTIKTVPYPKANAGNDTLICFGQSAQLIASGGSSYTWAPASYLTATTIRNPVSVKPVGDIRYIVSITDTLGCPKPATDSIWVRVYPKIKASTGIRDTSIVIGQTIQLNAGGGTNADSYLWVPPNWLSSDRIKSPVAAPETDIEYKVQITTQLGNCTGRDSVRIKVFLLPPSFYVPTAFSPNADGNNDVLRPIALGIRRLNYFKVFNRLGQLVFSTTEIGKGWDGFYKGNPQDPAGYVWLAEGVTFKGEVITRKGNAVLIR